MAGQELTVEGARALFQAGRLRELVGAAPDASPDEVKAACKRALLQCHPDKGGDTQVFNIIRPATEALQLDENLCAFEDGIVPSWAKLQLESIAETRREIKDCQDRIQAAKAREEAARTEGGREKARSDMSRHQQGIANLAEALELDLRRLKACYTEHVEIERERKAKEATRQEVEATAMERQRLQDERDGRALQRQRERGLSKRFPMLPSAIRNKEAHDTHTSLRDKYQSVRHASLKCKRRGKDATELESTAADFMQQAREHVRHWAGVAHEEVGDRSRRFPKLPREDPRHDEMVRLRREHTRLKDRLRKAKSEEQRASLQTRIDEAREEAIALLGRQK